LAQKPADDAKKVGFLYYASAIFVLFLVGLITAFAPENSLWVWDLVFLLLLAFLVTFFAAIGKSLTGRNLGIFINGRNRMDLSRFQIVLWTLLILPAFATIALERIRWLSLPANDPLQIAMDPRLWALLGISATSLVGTSLTSSEKKKKEPDPKKVRVFDHFVNERLKSPEWKQKIDKAIVQHKDLMSKNLVPQLTEAAIEADTMRSARHELEGIALREVSDGLLSRNKTVYDAKFSNIFESDEVAGIEQTTVDTDDVSIKSSYVDLSKVQMFFFTALAIFTYAVLLLNQFAQVSPATINSFPALSDGLVAILGISHAGFLGNNAVDHTPQT